MEESLFLDGAPEIGLEPNPDLYIGRVTFDGSLLSGVGMETFGPESGLKVFLLDDPRVNETLDIRPNFPQVKFQDGELIGLDWDAVYHPFTVVPVLEYPGDFVKFVGDEFTDGFDPTFYTPEDEERAPVLGFGTVEFTKVNEPGKTLGLAIASLSIVGFYRKKAINSSKKG